ncbi:MAG TPA: hypoxanthine phosphoribosyltransferase [Anaerolineaceae bacterium]|nr:hypoxanthine phosphoribosyltransferase [Anaerolineaceae bacterium]
MIGAERHFPYDFIDRVIISEADIRARVQTLGDMITHDFQNSDRLLLLGLLRGSVVFLTDLMREIRRPITMDFMSVSSYNKSESSGFVRIDSDHKTNIRGWDVVLIDDIVDSGYTIRTIRKLLLDREPRSLKVCALLDKPERHKVDIAIDYLGFSIPDYFVVGYGLDYDEKGRNLPYIAAVDFLKSEG